MLRISRVHYPVTALGPGRRLGVWFQGCPLACAGCVARDTWDPDGGREVAVSELASLWRAAVADGADGLTVSGGEPLEQPGGLGELLAAGDSIRAEAAHDADLLVYTGYEEADITGAAAEALSLADAVITGRYDVTRPTRLIWRGSANQHLSARTPLGELRYSRYLDHAPARAPMQVAADGGNLWFVGVPRRGDLPRLERALRHRGITWEGVTWRP
jgi:anaerobic ribonucleoside-triphosphate reductase activating protein